MKNHHGVKHLAIIIDGNRRWAKKRGLPTLVGHQRGHARFKQFGDWCLDRGIEVMTVFAFSTENWNRSKKEVAYLMRLLEMTLLHDVDELHRKQVRLRVIGRIHELPKRMQVLIAKAMELTKDNSRATLQMAINYGGRAEIVDAMKDLYRTAKSASQITEASVSRAMYSAGIPDPDMIIRTSGELRTSGFLAWQGVYSELYFSPKMWPDYTEGDLDEALVEFGRRRRRFGK